MNSGAFTDMSYKASVGTGAYVYTVLGLPLADVVALLTAIYLIAQIIIVAPKVLNTIRAWFKKEPNG